MKIKELELMKARTGKDAPILYIENNGGEDLKVAVDLTWEK